MKEVKGNFLILRKIAYKESDLIIHGLSETGAKISFIAKGGARSKKRFSGGILEPTHHVNLLYRENESVQNAGGLNLLMEASLINDFPKVRLDYDRLEFALQVVKAASAVSLEGDEESKSLYFLIGHTLKALEIVQDLETLKLHFFIKLLKQQGVLPESEWIDFMSKQSIHNSESLKALRLEHQEEAKRLFRIAEDYLKTAESHQSFLSPRG